MKDEILIGKVKQSIGQVKTDCFAYAKGECKALKELYCKKEKCKFYKTEKEYREGLEKYPPLKTKGLKL